jgi:hypothetical protein
MSRVPMPAPASTSSMPATKGPAEQGRYRRERSGRRQNGVLPRAQPDQRGRDHAHRGAKRDEWGLRTEHRAEREGAERRKRHARAPGKRRGLGAEPLEGRTPAVPG